MLSLVSEVACASMHCVNSGNSVARAEGGREAYQVPVFPQALVRDRCVPAQARHQLRRAMEGWRDGGMEGWREGGKDGGRNGGRTGRRVVTGREGGPRGGERKMQGEAGAGRWREGAVQVHAEVELLEIGKH
eukprot:1441109-Rhodomonas_salina.2